MELATCNMMLLEFFKKIIFLCVSRFIAENFLICLLSLE